jgi:hypothetical protein
MTHNERERIYAYIKAGFSGEIEPLTREQDVRLIVSLAQPFSDEQRARLSAVLGKVPDA